MRLLGAVPLVGVLLTGINFEQAGAKRHRKSPRHHTATRERVNHAMVAFKTAGSISVDPHHRITIHDRTALADRCR